MRRAGRTDANQKSIVDGLRAVGATVLILSGVGKGCPDLCVGWKGRNILVELKVPGPPSKQRLTPDEVAFHAAWRGKAIVATTLAEVLTAFLAP